MSDELVSISGFRDWVEEYADVWHVEGRLRKGGD